MKYLFKNIDKVYFNFLYFFEKPYHSLSIIFPISQIDYQPSDLISYFIFWNQTIYQNSDQIIYVIDILFGFYYLKVTYSLF